MVVQGDSHLVISFLNGRAKPSKPSFFLVVKALRARIKSLHFPIVFEHIPRSENKLADWLTNIPRVLERDFALRELRTPLTFGDSPPFEPAAIRGELDPPQALNFVAVRRADELDRCT